MYMPINPLGYSCIKKLQRDNLWHAYNEPINIYSVYNFSSCFETAADYVYISESNKNWEKYLTQRW